MIPAQRLNLRCVRLRRARWRARRAAAGLGFVLSAISSVLQAQSQASHLDQVQLTRVGDVYHVQMRLHLHVPAQRAFELFTDYPQLARLNPAVQTVRVLSSSEQSQRVYSEVHVCMGVFCKTLHQLQSMSTRHDDTPTGRAYEVRAELIAPEIASAEGVQTDFKSGEGRWRFGPRNMETDVANVAEAQGENDSELQAQLNLTPNFWVPPLIGPMMMEHLLREQAEQTATGIEREAARS